MIIVKKYGNRRLYDTGESRYVTQDELAVKIRAGADVRVVDARTGADLTQATLAQIILDGRQAGRLLPVPLLVQLIRMEEDAFADFFGTFVSWALDLYNQTRRGLEATGSFNPLTAFHNPALNPFLRLFSTGAGAAWGGPPEPRTAAQAPPPDYARVPEPPPSMAAEPPPSYTAERDDQIAQLRRDMEELKAALRGAVSSPPED